MKRILFLVLFLCPAFLFAQALRWSKDGNSFYRIEANGINQYTLPANTKSSVVDPEQMTDGPRRLELYNFKFSEDQTQLLLYTDAVTVWRIESKGDYWVMDVKTREMKKLGKGLPESSLMFAKFSPDGKKVAYVSQQNLYVEDLATGKVAPLTTNGTRKLINGTFDWAYEEELGCRDGFQWSPDSQNISYWNIDANKIRDFYMINNTDSVYSKVTPVEYPTMGQSPSPAKIGVINANTLKTIWLAIPGDPQQHYLPRMEWNSASELLIQQLNRRQNESKIFSCNPATGAAKMIQSETDAAWVEVFNFDPDTYAYDFRHRFIWLNGGKEFLWMSDKDGWTHLYRISKDGTKETLITKGNFDVIQLSALDEKTNTIYFMASPTNATQKYLYKTKLDGKGKLERVSPAEQEGTHSYNISPNGKYARHSFSSNTVPALKETIDLTSNKVIKGENENGISLAMSLMRTMKTTEFFKIKTEEGVEMDGWMVKPKNFDATKKYPVVFYVYTEPAGQTVTDVAGVGHNFLYTGSMADDGYIYMSVDNRGTPAPKGREWRKSIYLKVGQINIRDQALAAKEILKWSFVDPERIAVWGWSGGGSATLNLMFQYPEIYKTGIAVAAVGNQLTYDNIYQERYMGLPQEHMKEILAGSAITYAGNLKGNLLYIHGTGDDNVHYANAEMLVNELIRYNKQFQFMPYPNRTHSISEGEGTFEHLSTLYTNYLRTHCPPGPR